MQENHKSVQGAPDRPVVLIGLMGVGKSTVGRRLAARLGLPFVDADEEIEKAAHMSISEIFRTMGETAFRDGERRVLQRLLHEPPQIIATGGGAFMNEETRSLILERGTAVWLDATLDVLVERVSRRGGRPLLEGKNPRDVLRDLAAVRNPVYAQAPIHVKSVAGPHEQTVEHIVKALQTCP